MAKSFQLPRSNNSMFEALFYEDIQDMAPRSVLDAFSGIYLHFIESDSLCREITPDYSFVINLYHLTPGQAEVIAYLLHYAPSEVIDNKIYTLTDNRDEDSVLITNKLIERGFITQRITSNEYHTCMSISEEAMTAFKNNVPFKTAWFQDCFKELKYTPHKAIGNIEWIETFNKSLKLENNKQFKNAYEKLNIGNLSIGTQATFWSMVKFFIDHFSKPYDIEECNLETIDTEQTLSELISQGLVSTTTIEEDSKVKVEYQLDAKVIHTLFYGREELIKYDELTKYANLIKHHDIAPKELYYSQDAQSEINNLKTLTSIEGFNRACKILKQKKRPKNVISLLWGPPGTDKTECVKQLAFESKRDLFVFDISKVLGTSWGASEKLHRGFFRAYKYISAMSKNAPIILMNEADAILSKRLTNLERAIDKSENSLSNIILEEFESLEGILIATTNLIENLDPAFDRRFLFKTQLTKPNAITRCKIWKIHIPELTDEEAERLANTYEMSGAQINNVTTKRDLAELYFTGDRGFEYIAKLCETELSTEQKSGSKQSRIGF